MIKIDVDMTKCQHYGQCVFEAPNVFRLNEDDKLEYLAEADDSELGNIEAASMATTPNPSQRKCNQKK